MHIFLADLGTGKTSTAKLMAKAINCENNKDGNPCENCILVNLLMKQLI